MCAISHKIEVHFSIFVSYMNSWFLFSGANNFVIVTRKETQWYFFFVSVAAKRIEQLARMNKQPQPDIVESSLNSHTALEEIVASKRPKDVNDAISANLAKLSLLKAEKNRLTSSTTSASSAHHLPPSSAGLATNSIMFC